MSTVFESAPPLLTTCRTQIPEAGPVAGPVMKYADEDFLVKESMTLELGGKDGSTVQYLLLRKRGYTTMEAIRLVAAATGVDGSDVTYGGLKDEDAITEQYIAIPAGSAGIRESWDVATGGERWIELRPYGYGDKPLLIGGLEGNAFRITVRNLDRSTSEALGERHKVNHLFLNYYDTQRFGVPGAPKRTHMIGSAILDGRWDSAIATLREIGSPESVLAKEWQGSAKDFFLSLDARTVSFYLASHASGEWNDQLAAVVREHGGQDTLAVELEGIPYVYSGTAGVVARVLAEVPELPFTRYTFADGVVTERQSVRSTVIQAQIRVTDQEEDLRFPNRWQVGLSLFLPSGVYATAAVRQFFVLSRGDQ